MVQRAMDQWGRLDILINTAGGGSRGLALDYDRKTFDDVLTLNVTGTFLCCQAAARVMIPRGDGRIVNFASIAGLIAYPGNPAYIASKGGVVQITRSLAVEWATTGVRVNADRAGRHPDRRCRAASLARARLLRRLPRQASDWPLRHPGRDGRPRPLPLLGRLLVRHWPCARGGWRLYGAVMRMSKSMDRDIARQRLHTQRIAGEKFQTPDAVVRWFGAVQAQDYAGAKWAVGQRMHGATDADLDAAFATGTILRTHVMRPTWHFVTPADIRWLLALTAPRVHIANAYRCRQLALDDATLTRSNAALTSALRGGVQLTRTELAVMLQEAGIAIDGQRLTHIMMHAELTGIVCSGAWRGKQFTYALLDERAPHTTTLTREESLAELTTRYFTSHGPATVRDFVWWSGLTMSDAKAGLAMAESQVMHEDIDGGRIGSLSPRRFLRIRPRPPSYCRISTNSSSVTPIAATSSMQRPPRSWTRGAIFLFNHTIVINGRVRGTWKRTLKKDAVLIDALPFASLGTAEAAAIEGAAARYGRFIGLPATLRIGL